jgi:hypothetical protein
MVVDAFGFTMRTVAHILSVWLITAFRLKTFSDEDALLCSDEGTLPATTAGGVGGGGRISVDFVMDIDAGRIMGRISDIIGRRAAMLTG